MKVPEKPQSYIRSTVPPVRGVAPIGLMVGDDEQDTLMLREMAKAADSYLRSFAWCESIVSSFFGDGVGGVVSVFLFQIVPAEIDVDEWLWVVVGDLPPAYFVTDDLKDPHQVLDAYIWHRSQWTESVLHRRQPSDDVMPVNVAPSRENAQQLAQRLELLRKDVLPFFGAGEGDL